VEPNLNPETKKETKKTEKTTKKTKTFSVVECYTQTESHKNGAEPDR
jgi:hypothetical protein